MNRNLVKLTITSARDDLKTIVNKFLSSETFTSEDLRWWWNPTKNEKPNRIYAYRALNILKIEKCLTWKLPFNNIFDLKGYIKYKKTESFIEILNELLDIELLLNKCGVRTFEPEIENAIILNRQPTKKLATRKRQAYWNNITLTAYQFGSGFNE